jgi:hypothetical protein
MRKMGKNCKTSPTGFEPMPPKRCDVEGIQVTRLNHSATVTG